MCSNMRILAEPAHHSSLRINLLTDDRLQNFSGRTSRPPHRLHLKRSEERSCGLSNLACSAFSSSKER